MLPYILVVDDDPKVLALVADTLGTNAVFEVGQARSAQDALKRMDIRCPDLLILDIMMPEMSGLELCRYLRRHPRFATLPILFLTARRQLDDVVEGLEAGGDDYVPKPFQPIELQARVAALLRRAQYASTPRDVLRVGALELDPNACQARIEGRTVGLTATECSLLHYLMAYAGQAHTPDQLLEAVWEYPPGVGDQALVRMHIRNLRLKIEVDASLPQYILTIRGVGYMVSA